MNLPDACVKMGPCMFDALLHRLSRSVWPAIFLAAVAVIIAASVGAILLYDGAWFLFQILDRHTIDIPQLRMSFALLQWPAVWVAWATDSVALTRFVFGLFVMATPPISLALSWWIVRKQAPWLMVWPALGLLLVDLPGQMHWIATSIRTNQLFWPLLLAVFIGMPDRVVSLSMILLISAMFMHPQVSVFLISGACAAVWLGVQRPEQRQRLFSAAGVFMFASLYRFGIQSGGYETDEATLSNQIGQWQRSTLGWPLVALVCVGLIASLLLWDRHGHRPLPYAPSLYAALAVIGAVALFYWAADSSRWRDAIDYRGPSMWHSLLLMGLAFLDVILPGRDTTSSGERSVPPRLLVTNGAALVFSIVIGLQSLSLHSDMTSMRHAMATSETACVPQETVAGLADSPMNFWSLPAASIGLQTVNPNHVILPSQLCTEAETNGVIPMTLTVPRRDTPGRYVNMFHLRAQITQGQACWAAFDSGWYPEETGNNESRRWTSDTGSLNVVMDEAGTITLSGILDSFEIPNEVRIIVNGVVQRTITVEGERYTPLDGTTLSLEAGANVIEIDSMRRAGQPDGDPRDLAIAIINLELRATSDNSVCRWQE